MNGCICAFRDGTVICSCPQTTGEDICESCQNGLHTFIQMPSDLPMLQLGDLYRQNGQPLVFVVTTVTNDYAEMQLVNGELTLIGTTTPWDGFEYAGRYARAVAYTNGTAHAYLGPGRTKCGASTYGSTVTMTREPITCSSCR